MESNLLLEQFGRYKRLELESSPFHFLLDANIELNPHQINAFCAAVQALKTGGIVLADEVGLGKTIEAGLIIKELKARGLIKRILVVCPTGLVTQWNMEMEEKFGEKFRIILALIDKLTAASQNYAFDTFNDMRAEYDRKVEENHKIL